MCGLVGMAADFLSDRNKSTVEQMLWASTLRGFDATGIANITAAYDSTLRRPSGAEAHIFKHPGTAPHVMPMEGFKKAIGAASCRAIIGHNRAKTIGINNEKNAHPFRFKKLVGAHNGTLTDYPYRNTFETDSECLYSAINDLGIEQAIKDTAGAYALTWFDFEKETLNFLRNKERTLWLCSAVNHTELYWSSERGILNWILDRMAVNHTEPFLLKADHHVSFNIFEKDFTQTIDIKELKGKEKEAWSYGNHDRDFFPGWRQELTETEKAKRNQALLPRPMLVKSSNGVSLATVGARSVQAGETPRTLDVLFPKTGKKNKGFKGYGGVHLQSKEYIELLSDGCLWCSKIEAFNKPHRWVNHTSYLCSACKDSDLFKCTTPPEEEKQIILLN